MSEPMAETLKLTPNETLTIVGSTPEALEVEAVYGPGGRPPPRHSHPAQDEHFRIIEGSVRVRFGREEIDLEAGEELDVPAGLAHQIWNPSDAPARVSWLTTPAGRTEQWFRAVDALNREAAPKTPSALGFAVALNEYRDTFRLVVGPHLIVLPAISVLARVGRLRGHRVPAGAGP
jgi:mannose-6-phosphate isomerase-like protein (cupin superfamily)